MLKMADSRRLGVMWGCIAQDMGLQKNLRILIQDNHPQGQTRAIKEISQQFTALLFCTLRHIGGDL